MGARTNFTFVTDTGALTLYSHWGGDSKFVDLAHGLSKAMPRIKMGDVAYALRIVVSQIIGPEWDNETGFGLHVGTEGGEEQYTAVTVDFTNNTVEDGRGVHSIQDFIAYHGMDEQSINNKIKMASDAFLEKHSTI
jgi:hypothetical protein